MITFILIVYVPLFRNSLISSYGNPIREVAGSMSPAVLTKLFALS
jgi:hypothetical protein